MSKSFARFAPFTDRDIELFLVDELNDDDAQKLRSAIDSSPSLKEHIEDRRASQRAFAQLHPPPAFLAENPPVSRWMLFWKTMPLFAAMAGVFLWSVAPATSDGITARGNATAKVEVIVKRGERLFPLSQTSKALLRAGDALRVDIKDAKDAWVALGLLSDSHGLLLVEGKTNDGIWQQPSSLILDNAIGSETLVVLIEVDSEKFATMKQKIERGILPPGARAWHYEKEPM